MACAGQPFTQARQGLLISAWDVGAPAEKTARAGMFSRLGSAGTGAFQGQERLYVTFPSVVARSEEQSKREQMWRSCGITLPGS